ncbi:MKRN2 opposite strand protein isoform X2 [Anopheles nili]|nr:MKRN2 opposite strand protein isoform X2 [Anopheles nili]
MYRDLICIHHCGKKIFTLDQLFNCPLCNKALGVGWDDTPLNLPSPFIRAVQNPCSIVLRPSGGDFLSSFQNNDDLHIGITSSKGAIVEYDIYGILKTPPKADPSTDKWNQCLLIAQVSEPWFDWWDEVLEQISTDEKWRKETYDENSHNCYSFVLSFLNAVGYSELSTHCHDRFSFSEKFIVVKTQNAAKYISIYRKLQIYRYFIDEDCAK